MRRLLTLLATADRRELAWAVGVALASGVASSLLVAIIAQCASRPATVTLALAGWFSLLVLLALLSRIASQLLLIHLVQGTVYRLRLQLCGRIVAAPLAHLERLRPGQLLATLTDDVQAVADAVQGMPFLCYNLATLVGCLAYLAWLSPPILIGTLALLLPGVASYRLVEGSALAAMRRARLRYDTLIDYFRSVVEGVKELQLHPLRRQDFFRRGLEATAQSCRQDQFRGLALYSVAGAWTQLWLMLWLGLLLFALPRFWQVDPALLVAYCLTVLYMLRPVDFLLHILPVVARAEVALQQVESLDHSLQSASTPSARPAETAASPLAPATGVMAPEIVLAGVTHRYADQGGEHAFTLGPLDLTVSPGKVLFLTGGNGSGKSTLAKVLTGLYWPDEGQIRVAGQVVGEGERASYRQLFSAVFADAHLFDRWYGLNQPSDAEVAQQLVRLKLSGRVRLSPEGIEPRGLSQGQRKRVALVTALLENRPLYVFDEWASEQDPEFKEYFYRCLLAELRERGKSVVVISHDDRYFHLADQRVKLEDGQIVEG